MGAPLAPQDERAHRNRPFEPVFDGSFRPWRLTRFHNGHQERGTRAESPAGGRIEWPPLTTLDHSTTDRDRKAARPDPKQVDPRSREAPTQRAIGRAGEPARPTPMERLREELTEGAAS
ncbi:hypothetical protein GCM10009854_34930 [Saccharopolyspora halophila]|uniref:Uncharacterized protein n=1 Tax=Saccharopolyspora halophila TaxID=405551 RepID=A0ABN3GKF0_9PSEU